MKNILAIEDDPTIAAMVRQELQREGFHVVVVTDGSQGLAQLRKSTPHLLILDLSLPSLSGFDICKAVRREERLQGLPILILSGRAEEADCVLALELGANDYVVKPYRPRELLARVRALLRNTDSQKAAQQPLEIGPFRLDPAMLAVFKKGKLVPMSTTEFRLLYYLASRPNQVFSREQLLDAAWGTERMVATRSVDTFVYNLRVKLEEDPNHAKYLRTIRGAGYVFVAPDKK